MHYELCIIHFSSDLVEGLSKVVDDVVDMLGADAQTHGGWRDVLFGELFGRELRVGGGVGVDDQALYVGHVG